MTTKSSEGKGIKENLFITKGGWTITIFNKWVITLFSKLITMEELKKLIK